MLYITTTAVVACAIALGSASAQTPQYTSKSLKVAMQTANTADEYNRLATYFEERSVHYRQLSEEHGKAVQQELEHPTPGVKYPTAVDRSRRLQEYDLDLSKRAHARSEHFKALALRDTATQSAR